MRRESCSARSPLERWFPGGRRDVTKSAINVFQSLSQVPKRPAKAAVEGGAVPAGHERGHGGAGGGVPAQG